MSLRLLTAIVVLSPCARVLACDAANDATGCGPALCITGTNQASVSIVAFVFQPGTLTIPIGASVRWSNDDPSDHTVTSLPAGQIFDSGLMGPGAVFDHTFHSLGAISYVCAIHFGMDGELNVRGPGDATGDDRTDIADFAVLAANFNLQDTTYTTGDFDLTEATDIADFAILAANFNSVFDAGSRGAVPEPLGATMAVGALLARRRSRPGGKRTKPAASASRPQ